MQDVQTAAENLGQIVATPYPSLTYPVPLGKYTYYNGNLYRCVSPIASSESFTPAHWSNPINLGDEVSALKSAIVPENLVPVSPTWNVGDGVQNIVFSNALPEGKYKLFVNVTSSKSSETSVRLYLSKTDTFPSTSSGNRILSTSVTKNTDTWIDVDVSSQIKSLWLQVASTSTASSGYTITVNKEPIMYNRIVFTDESLLIPDMPADAKAVGDQINPIQIVYPSNADDWTTDASNITARLAKYGYCKLAPGTYRISTIGMPNGKTKPMTLEGSGKNTIIIVENGNGYGIRISNNCSVRNLVLRNENTSYAPADIYTASTIKHGIKITKTTGSDKCHAVIENVSIENFSGAGILVDATGQGTSDGNHILNCFVDNCGAGLWLNQYAEFNRVECCNFDSCYYGVICDGGNNTICNCGMSRNIYGFYMNNGSGNLQNNSHSQVVGCIFNHEDYDAETGGKGWSIWINGAESGLQFVGGQIFYGGIYVKNSVATCINDFNIGKMIENGEDVGIKIQLDHDDPYTRLVVLNNCIFAKVPRIIKPENDPKLVLYLNNCYTRGGTPITP
jgi:hypothetical protein